MRNGESAPRRWPSPETQTRATALASSALRRSYRNLTSRTDRKNDAKIVSTCRFHPTTRCMSYRQFRVLNTSPSCTEEDFRKTLHWPSLKAQALHAVRPTDKKSHSIGAYTAGPCWSVDAPVPTDAPMALTKPLATIFRAMQNQGNSVA